MEHYHGLVRKGMSMSKSSPCIAASFKLREYSQSRNRLPAVEPPPAAAPSLSEIDRLGGNGRWRQRQAEDFFEKKRVEDKLRAQEERREQQEKLRRRQERDARRLRLQREQEERCREKEERQRLGEEDQQARQRQQLEHERQVKEKEQREWRARQPQPCEDCQGSGLCSACDGTGEVHSLFLVGQVDKCPALGRSFGRALQGCTQCGGCRQGLVGGLQPGSGQCPGCNGKGKVWPEQAFVHIQRKLPQRRLSQTALFGLTVGSPKMLQSGFSSPHTSAYGHS